MKLRRTLFAAGAAASALWATGVLADTLPEAIAYAYSADPGIAAQRAALRGLNEQYVQARAGLGPNLQLSVGSQDQTQERAAADNGLGAGNTQSRGEGNFASLALTQPLYVGGRGAARLTGAEAKVESGRQTLRRAELDLIFRVVSAYSAVRRDEEIVRISTDAVQVLERQLSNTQAKFDVRQVTATDLAQARARLASARTNLLFAQNALATSRSQYLEAVGKNPTDLAPEPPLHNLPATIDQAFDIAERNNPQLLSAAYTEQASGAEVAEARAIRRPNVSLRIEGRKSGNEVPYEETSRQIESLTGTLTITQPLFASGAINSQIRQVLAQHERDKLTVESVRKQVIQDVSESWDSLSTARKSIVTIDEEMKANEVAFYGVREEERFALRTTLDILNAEAELRSSQLNLIRARSTEYVRRVQLLATTGALDIRTLAPNVTPYDPEKDFNEVKNNGQLPWEPVVRALDRLGGAPIPPHRPATREDTRPDNASSLPPAPPDAADMTPIVPTSELVTRRNRESTPPAAASGGGQAQAAPAPGASDGDPIGALAEKALKNP